MINRINSVLLLVVLVFVVVMVILGCAQQGTEVLTAQTQTYFPHEDGYLWEYRYSIISGETDTIASATKVFYFDGNTTLSNGLVVQNFMLSTEALSLAVSAADTLKMFEISPGLSSYYYVSENGVYCYGTPVNPTTEAELIIPLPLQVGDVWTSFGSTYEAIGTEEVTVPAGTFTTIKIYDSKDDLYKWYADGVGLVKLSLCFSIPLINEDGTISVTEPEYHYIGELVNKNF